MGVAIGKFAPMPHRLGHGQPGSSRRTFLTQSSIVVLGTLELVRSYAAPATGYPSLAKKSPLRLGLVSYNLAKDWDISTILKNCSETGFEGIELRTTHAHGVEVSLSKEARGEVRKRFADSAVVLMGLGSAFDFHTPDPAKLRRDIEATKEYIVLSHDVGGSGVKVRPNGFQHLK